MEPRVKMDDPSQLSCRLPELAALSPGGDIYCTHGDSSADFSHDPPPVTSMPELETSELSISAGTSSDNSQPTTTLLVYTPSVNETILGTGPESGSHANTADLVVQRGCRQVVNLQEIEYADQLEMMPSYVIAAYSRSKQSEENFRSYARFVDLKKRLNASIWMGRKSDEARLEWSEMWQTCLSIEVKLYDDYKVREDMQGPKTEKRQYKKRKSAAEDSPSRATTSKGDSCNTVQPAAGHSDSKKAMISALQKRWREESLRIEELQKQYETFEQAYGFDVGGGVQQLDFTIQCPEVCIELVTGVQQFFYDVWSEARVPSGPIYVNGSWLTTKRARNMWLLGVSVARVNEYMTNAANSPDEYKYLTAKYSGKIAALLYYRLRKRGDTPVLFIHEEVISRKLNDEEKWRLGLALKEELNRLHGIERHEYLVRRRDFQPPQAPPKPIVQEGRRALDGIVRHRDDGLLRDYPEYRHSHSAHYYLNYPAPTTRDALDREEAERRARTGNM